MKRLCGLVVLLLATSSAHADSIAFSVAGHRVRIDAPRNCRSASCASISIPGVYESRRKRFDDDDRDVAASPPPAPPAQPAAPPAPAPAYVPPVQPAPPSKLIVTMVPAPMPLALYQPAAVATQQVAPPPAASQPCAPSPADRPADIRPAPATPAARPPVLKVLREEDNADTPIGIWQTESKGMVRIVECGKALCGYAVKPGDVEKGEAVLINMKPKTAAQWSGSVYSKSSGDTYYGTINLNGPNTLRVEACAIGRFYCSDNHWARVVTPEGVMTSRQVTQEPRT